MIHFITGKGGVGKSLAAASLAKSFSEKGRKTLLVELGGSRFFEFVYGRPLEFHSRPLTDSLSMALWEGEECLREYLQHLIKIPRVADLFFDNRIMQALVHGAPGLKELALAGKITSRERGVGPKLPYDELVIDSYSTGHFLALLSAPSAMAEAISFGPMSSQSRGIHRILSGSQCRYYVVVNPEELPLTEGLELAGAIEAKMVRRPRLIKNRWWPSSDLFKGSLNLPASFLEKWRRMEQLQNGFDFKGFSTAVCLPQIWDHSNRRKIDEMSKLWDSTT